MINKFLTTIGVLLAVTLQGIGQATVAFPVIDKNDLPGAVFEAPRTFNGSSLYGYIDGGADLYLEYGFAGAWVNEVNWQGGKYTIELYKMNSPEDAFGIYSVSRYRCRSTPALTPFTCQARYQLQIVAGPYYISIINSTGTPADSTASLGIGHALVSKISEEVADLSKFIPDVQVQTINLDALLVKGELGVRNGAPDLVNLFKDITGYRALILPQTEQTLVSVIFTDREKAEAFCAMHSAGSEKPVGADQQVTANDSVTRISDNQVLIAIKKP